jgi:hypothetical protein
MKSTIKLTVADDPLIMILQDASGRRIGDELWDAAWRELSSTIGWSNWRVVHRFLDTYFEPHS